MLTQTLRPLLLFLLLTSISQADELRLELNGFPHNVPIKVYLPDQPTAPSPVILFSHGLGGSREGSSYLGRHWASAGYVVVAVQHIGSDQTAWKGLPKSKIRKAIEQAASIESFLKRISDIHLVLNYLERNHESDTHPLHGKLDTNRIAMTGHSFGAVTSQAIMGQNFKEHSDAPFFDARIDCAILMSPSQSRHIDNQLAFGSITLPVLCMTGTQDQSPLDNGVTPESRKDVYASLPLGQAYQVVFNQGTHSIFGDYRRNNPRYHSAILELSTHFLDAYLKQNEASLKWLRSTQANSALTINDTWEWK